MSPGQKGRNTHALQLPDGTSILAPLLGNGIQDLITKGLGSNNECWVVDQLFQVRQRGGRKSVNTAGDGSNHFDRGLVCKIQRTSNLKSSKS